MEIAQRGTTISSGLGVLTYTLDRWTVAAAGAAVSVSAAVDVSAPYVSYMSITGAAGNTSVGIRQRIEHLNTKDLAGQTVTVSFLCYNATSNATSATIQLNYPTAKDNYTSITSSATQNINLANSSSRQSFTFTVPTSGANGIEFNIFAYNLTNGVFVLRDVQLEFGSIATPFEHRPIQTELALCQRYYEKSFQQATAPAQNTGLLGAFYMPQIVGASTGSAVGAVSFKVSKRATPATITLFNPSAANAQIRNTSINSDWSATSITNSNESNFAIFGTTAPGSSAGQAAYVHWIAEAEL